MGNWSVVYEVKDPLAAVLTLIGLESCPGLDPVKLCDSINEGFTIFRPEELTYGNLPDQQKEQLRAYERALADLTAQVAKVGELAGNIAERQAEYFRERSEKMDSTLEGERATLRDAHQVRLDDVARKEAALNERIQNLDLREHTTARRALAKTTREAIREVTGARAQTWLNMELYMPHLVSWVVIGACSWGIVYFIGDILANEAGTASPYSYAPLIGLTVIGASTLFFYLRFLALWAERFALNRRIKEKYAIDFNRADWLTELVFEYNEQNRAFPPEVMARLAQGLFSEVSWDKRNVHPGDDLLDLLQGIAKISVAKDGAVVQMKDREKAK